MNMGHARKRSKLPCNKQTIFKRPFPKFMFGLAEDLSLIVK